MSPVGQPYKGYVQWGRETAGNYGVAVASTHRARHLGLRPGPRTERIQSDVMDGTGLAVASYVGKKMARFGVDLELTYTGLLTLFDLLMGTNTYGSNGGSTTGTNPYTH